ncbi:uncharacterized protein [Diadema antillarum]|uniref:uncharacterized protein n=1 Tax=Diadema antillarum TaxID=105358 RepID=UPI003A89AA1F
MTSRKRSLDQGVVTISHYFKEKEDSEPKMDFSDATTEKATQEHSDSDNAHGLTDSAVHTVVKPLHRDMEGTSPGASAESPPRSSLEKKRRVDGEKSTTDELLAALIHKIDEMNSNLTSRLDTALGKIETNEKEISNLKEEQESCRFDIKQLQDQVNKQEKENMKLRERLVDLTAREMRNTAVFNGFPEGAENAGKCEQLIKEFAKSNMQMEGEVSIERAHRTGSIRPKPSPPRPVVVAFSRYTTRQTVISSARRCLKERPFQHSGKDHQIFVDEMLPVEVRESRRKLLPLKRKLKEEDPKRKVYFKYPARLFYRETESGKEVEYKQHTTR